jgi:hypothetical protein
MAKPRIQIPRELKCLLDESGAEWTIDMGGHHAKLKICGVLVLAMPPDGGKSSWQGRRMENAMACVRRYLRSIGRDPRRPQ